MSKIYIDIEQHWPVIRPLAYSPQATSIWKRDLKKYHTAFRVYGHKLCNTEFDRKWFDRIYKFEYFIREDKPSDYDSCDWRENRLQTGLIQIEPEFWQFVVHAKCHWMVNFNLFLAINVFSKEPWRIITSNVHSCVWNGDQHLFDMNYYALVPDITEHPFYNKFGDDVTILPVGEEFQLNISDYDVVIVDEYDNGKISIDELRDYFFMETGLLA